MGFSTSLDSPSSLIFVLLLLLLPLLEQLQINYQHSSNQLKRACRSLARLLGCRTPRCSVNGVRAEAVTVGVE
jgi:hypothetical protein